MRSTSTTIRLGTRGSKLALTQSEQTANQLRRLGHDVELVILKTTGDVTTGPLSQFGGEGVFTKRLQIALLDNEIDLAVHSLKDLPTEPTPGLMIGSIPQREDARDALVLPATVAELKTVDALPNGFRIGTGSVRRRAQLLFLNPSLRILDIRGNVDTRLSKLDGGEYDAIVLASAGLNRLGLQHRISFRFSPNQIAPAVGQGALGLETRESDLRTQATIAPINDMSTFSAVTAERKMLNCLRAGCLAPVGAVSETTNNQLSLSGVVFSRDGTKKIQADLTGESDQASEIGAQVADRLLKKGAERMMRPAS